MAALDIWHETRRVAEMRCSGKLKSILLSELRDLVSIVCYAVKFANPIFTNLKRFAPLPTPRGSSRPHSLSSLLHAKNLYQSDENVDEVECK